MTDEQFQKCLQCLNRRKGTNKKEEICNIKGKDLNFTGDCSSFDKDNSVIVGVENKKKSIRPNLKRAKYAQILIGIILLLELVSILSSYLQLNLLNSLNDGIEISDEMLNNNDNREQLIGIIYTLVFIISSITFIQWFRRAYYNLNIRTNCNHSEGWASGSWFVPIISLYRPFQIMKELWTKTDNLIKEYKNDYLQKSTTIIGVWWTLWIISNYLGKYALKKVLKAETIQDFINSTTADIVIAAIGIPLAFITIKMIKEYSKKEELLNDMEKK
jgi:uncharacterized membrane protein